MSAGDIFGLVDDLRGDRARSWRGHLMFDLAALAIAAACFAFIFALLWALERV